MKVRKAGRIFAVTATVAVNDQARRVVPAFVPTVFAQDDAETASAL